MNLAPLSREQLQAEGVDGNKRAQIQVMLQGFYQGILRAARSGQKEYFVEMPEKIGLPIKTGISSYVSNDTFITHEDIIEAMRKIFPGVTITSILKRATAQVVYQKAGILLDWS